MNYGNSNGQNTGKKYFIRNRATKMDIQGEKIAEDLNKWFADNCKGVVTDLRRKSVYDADVFNETFVKIYDTLLYTNPEIKNFKAYFMRAYFTNRTQIAMKENRHTFVDLKFVNLPSSGNSAYEFEQKIINLENDIYNYINSHYDKSEYDIFCTYIRMKPAITYHSLSEMTKIPAHKIHKIVSKIKREVKGNENFSKRCKEIF